MKRFLFLYFLSFMVMSARLFSTTNNELEFFKFALESIRDKDKVNIYKYNFSDMREYFLSEHFNDDIRKKSLGASMTLIVDGFPESFGLDFNEDRKTSFLSKIQQSRSVQLESKYAYSLVKDSVKPENLDKLNQLFAKIVDQRGFKLNWNKAQNQLLISYVSDASFRPKIRELIIEPSDKLKINPSLESFKGKRVDGLMSLTIEPKNDFTTGFSVTVNADSPSISDVFKFTPIVEWQQWDATGLDENARKEFFLGQRSGGFGKTTYYNYQFVIDELVPAQGVELRLYDKSFYDRYFNEKGETQYYENGKKIAGNSGRTAPDSVINYSFTPKKPNIITIKDCASFTINNIEKFTKIKGRFREIKNNE